MGHTGPLPECVKSITITLPLPAKELSPNGRFHYQVKRKAVKAYRTLSKLKSWIASGLGNQNAKLDRAEVRIAWFTRTVHRPDGDNALASLKSAFDGIADSGFLSNDRGMTYHPIQFQKDKTNPRVEITVTEL